MHVSEGSGVQIPGAPIFLFALCSLILQSRSVREHVSSRAEPIQCRLSIVAQLVSHTRMHPEVLGSNPSCPCFALFLLFCTHAHSLIHFGPGPSWALHSALHSARRRFFSFCDFVTYPVHAYFQKCH